ncbi:MAG TPA: chloride channel protein [Methylophaga aminisulfidivorans]|jgi:chloride channel protein, CIC family|uniref:chloride channel protein n=1 Tax=Methylophaga TaxID=40222 RepID=UPI001750C765|nr:MULTISPECIES: chloride channel protein [Methylophaga]HIC46705.1 chloride channel protein [Methylophaga sp.]HIM41130.1 chloride channel protein [Methylophaga aminisulfidivorans]
MLEKLRQYFIFGRLGVKLYVLAVITGLLSSLAIILLRLTIDSGQMLLFPSGEVDSYDSLPWYWLLAMPIIGGLLIGLLFRGLDAEQRNTGILHVIERLSSYEGRLPWQNAVRQFIGTSIAIITGHSVGREGPGVHLGAASGSLLASGLELPNNSVRILVASGSAAAIAASFNTPIAGVIFAMEVIMMEYHIASFIPVILAAVTGAVVCRLTFGDDTVFVNLATQMQSLWELPYIIFLGIIIGGLATLSLKSLQFFSGTFSKHPAWIRPTYAGILMGIFGMAVPEVMGMGYGIIGSISANEIAIGSLVIILILKLVLSSACVGFGIPAGMVGPTMVVGACAGAILGYIGNLVMPEYASSMTFYAVIGMCAMMSATLKAPLAALMAMLELTGNPEIILPGMLAIVFSSLIIHDYFKLDALFVSILRYRGLDFQNDPISQALRKVSVGAAMQRNFVTLNQVINAQMAMQTLKNSPEWIIITRDRIPVVMMPASDLARAVSVKDMGENSEIDLMQIPGTRRDVHKISLHTSLFEAYQALNEHHVEALYVSRQNAPMIERIYGILTREMIEAHYQLPKSVTK